MNVISNDSGSATTGINVSVTRPRNAKITSIVHTGQSRMAGCGVVMVDLMAGESLEPDIPGPAVSMSSLIAGLGMLDYFRRGFLGCTDG